VHYPGWRDQQAALVGEAGRVSDASGHDANVGVSRLNALPAAEAVEVLLTCCGSRQWAARMAARRPFVNPDAVIEEAGRIWLSLEKKDWLEAFGHHPRIGERNLNQAKFGGAATAAQAGKEQSGMAAATDEQRREFATGNEEYERRFGHVFLICATGKTAATMLEHLRMRLNNDRATELANAAKEQAMITRLRLERWLTT
jgi:2-oxo-4-hydroxy-4-carboxy-5-ureidoimidazoline decarboxylase